jgi:ectoine hydroxylase
MKLTQLQLDQFEHDGFLVFPNGGPRIVYGLHDETGPTASRAYNALVRSPRILQPVRDLLGEDVYVYHTKCNTKQALEGAIYAWHQDYTNWTIMDGTPTHRILTSMVLLDKATELGGCLYFIPGSHRLGIVQPDVPDNEIDAAIRRVVEQGEPMPVPKEKLVQIVGELGEPVAMTGEPGTVVIFHGDMIHGSGHNMSIHARWILYTVFSAVSNRPQSVAKPRAEYKAARHAKPTELLDAPSIVEAIAAATPLS